MSYLFKVYLIQKITLYLKKIILIKMLKLSFDWFQQKLWTNTTGYIFNANI